MLEKWSPAPLQASLTARSSRCSREYGKWICQSVIFCLDSRARRISPPSFHPSLLKQLDLTSFRRGPITRQRWPPPMDA
ncbi:hypothetical protein RRG08_043682 [Elysia crispata]|uniref:Uncharacterized protein n=1 Tax=Elysia crispata TaxID=231223 RepID=A0AAE1DMN3_9GAST|nr:hypothetical protein RRG08_043682 [Elysia crispata]